MNHTGRVPHRTLLLLLLMTLSTAVTVAADERSPVTQDHCSTRITFVELDEDNAETDGHYTVTVGHENAEYITFDGQLMCHSGMCPKPLVRNLSVSCRTEPWTLKIEVVGGWYRECKHTEDLAMPAIDPTPVLTNARISHGFALFDYKFPYGSATREVRAEFLATASHGLVDKSTDAHMSGTAGGEHGAYDGVMRGVATACGDPAFRAETYVPLPVSDADCEESCGEECPDCVGSPVRTSSGNMRYAEVDPIPSVPFFPLKRTTVSRYRKAGLFGYYWFSAFDAWLRTTSLTVTLMTEDAAHYTFEGGADGVYVQRFGSGREPTTLDFDAVSGWWRHLDPRRGVERYFDADGKPVRYRDIRTDRYVDIEYDTNGRPARVADSWGHIAWTITTDPTYGTIRSIGVEGRTDLTWTYQYFNYKFGGGWGQHLETVTSPAGLWRKHVYKWYEPSYEYRGVSKIEDGAGNVIESHKYDQQTRSVSSIGPQGDIQSIAYDQEGRVPGETVTVVTYTNGRVERHYIRHTGDSFRTVEISGSCPSCASSGDAVLVTDAFGNVTRRQDARGYVAESTYSADGRVLLAETAPLRPADCDPETDPERCRMTPTELAQAAVIPTSQSVTTSYEYADPAWPDKPTAIVTPSIVVAGESRRESYTYHPVTGAVRTATISGFVPGREGSDREEARLSRTTTTVFYGDPAGTTCDGRPDCDSGGTGLEPAFDPGGAFETAWLSLPQPLNFRKSVQGPLGDVTSFVYYPNEATVPALLRGRLAAVKNALGHLTRYEDYDIFGNANHVVDPNGVATAMTYDALGRLLTTKIKRVSRCDTTRDPLCATDLTTKRKYYGTGPLESETRPDGSVTKYTYDTRSRLQTISRGPGEKDLRERIEFTYDSVTGEKTLERTLAFENAVWVEKRRQSFAYDDQGRIATVTHADGASVAYAYEPGGQIDSVRDENHASPNTIYDYDPAGQLTIVTQTRASAAAGSIATRYGYDIHGNLASVTDPNGNVTSYVYDDFGQMIMQSSPVTGATTYSYDLAGNLISTTDANGATTTRTYDLLGRVIAADSAVGTSTESVRWAYDIGASGSDGDGTSFSIGRLGRMTDPTGSTSYAYDRRGLLTSEAKTIGAATYVTGFAYDANGNRSRIDYPSSASVTFGFDFAGRPVSASRAGTPLVASAKYLPFGPLTEIVYGNGARKQVTHDTRYRVLTNGLTAGEAVIASYSYAHDPAGNITRIDDLVAPMYNRAFGYDDLNRLTSVTTSEGLFGTRSYGYDSMGNMTLQRSGEDRMTSFAYQGTTPKLASVTKGESVQSITYDAAGNEIAVGAQSYAYTPRNHLAGQNGLSYTYDGRGIRTVAARPVALASLSITPSSVAGGGSAQGTVTLTSPAPAEGAVLALASNHTAVTVPSSVTIAAGQVSATFTIATQAVEKQVNATISASFNGVTRTASLAIASSLSVTEMSVSPTSVAGGHGATGALRLSGAAPEEGAIVALASNHASVTVPSEVAVRGGNDQASFAITTSSVTSTITATITATLGTSTAQVALTVTTTPAVASLSITPSSVVGGSGAEGTVTLAAAAPADGAVVALASSHAAASVPSSVAVPAGQLSATFAIATQLVEAQVEATITATYDGATQSATLVVMPEAAIAEMGVMPSTVVGGNSATGSVRLSAAAPEGGAVVALASNDAAVTVPSQVVVSAGMDQASFAITTSPVTSTIAATITGTLGGSTAQATLTVTPPTLTLAFTPSPMYGGLPATGEVTLPEPAPAGGATVTLTTEYTGVTIPESVLVAEGLTSATFDVSATPVEEEMSAIVYAADGTSQTSATLLIAPPLLTNLTVSPAGVVGGNAVTAQVTLNAPAAAEGSRVAMASSHPELVAVPTSILVSSGETTASAALTTAAVEQTTEVVISATRNGVTYSATVTLEPPPLAVTQVTVVPSTVVGGNSATGNVRLNRAAPDGGAVVSLTSSDAVVVVPPEVVVTAGTTEASFAITTSSVTTTITATITATLGASTAQATLTVTPPMMTLAFTPSPMYGGLPASGEVTLPEPAPAGGATVTLTTEYTGVTIPESVVVAEGLTSATFDVSATPVEEEMSAIVYATYGTSQTSATLVIAPPVLTNLTVSPSTVVGGNAVTAEVTLNAPAGGEGAGVPMASSHPELVSTPVKIVVPSGQTSASAALTTAAVAETTQVVITATRYGITRSATVTLEPASGIQALGTGAAGVTTRTEGRTIVPVPANVTTSSGAEVNTSATAQPVALCASLALPPCLTATALDVVTLETQDPVDPTERQHYLYTPELNLLAETESATATVPPVAYEYIWFAGEPLAQVNVTTSEIHYYFNDHLGTPILQTDETARVVWQAEYDPYGGIHAIRVGEGKHQPLRLPGQEARGETDTSYNIYRWYRPGWGRYSQADPIGLRGDVNLYTYSRNPIREFDPLGLLRIRRREFYIHDPSMGGLGDRGNTTPRVRVTYECLPAGNCWRPEFSVLLDYTVRYRDANVRAHEEQHIVIFERDLYPLLNTLSQHEVRYATFDVCRQHARRAIANFERDINWFDFDHVIHDDGFSIFEWVATNAF